MSFWGETFTFNDVPCTDFDLMLYDIGDNGNDESDFASPVMIVDDTIGSNWKPHFYGVKFQNKLTFEMTFGVNQCRLDSGQHLTRSEIDSIASWLTRQDKYCKLTIDQEDMADYYYKCIITDLKLVDYGHMPLAFKATVTCDSPYAYHAPIEETFTLNGPTQIQIDCQSSANGFYYPKFEYTRTQLNISSFSIQNYTTQDPRFSLSAIPISVTTINIDGEHCLLTNNQDINLYGNCNYQWPRLVPGINNIVATGYGTLKITCEYPANIGA